MKTSGRIKTYYGITVPPWRHEPVLKSVTLVFVLTGRIPSKKNEQVGVVERSDAFKMLNVDREKQCYSRAEVIAILFKTFSRIKNSEDYADWEYQAMEIFKSQLRQQHEMLANKGLIFPLTKGSVKIKFYWKGKYRRDNSNKSEGIHDALVRANVISDDCGHVLGETAQSSGDYTDEVTNSIAVIYVTTPV